MEKLKIIKKDKRGFIYNCGKLKVIIRKRSSISAGHKHRREETLYLIKGKAKLITDKQKINIKVPTKIKFDSNIYHKLIAVTDIILLEGK